MLEGPAPGFNRVCSHPCIPMQFVNREVAMFDRRQDRGEPRILHMGVRPELQPVETHRHSPGHPPAESAGKKIRHLQAMVVDSIAAMASESRCMKDLIRQRDVLPGITPGALDLAARELTFSAYIDPARRHHRFAQGLPEIQQIDPAAVTEVPLRIREAIHFCLSIEMRVSGTEYPLLKREAIPPKGEFRR